MPTTVYRVSLGERTVRVAVRHDGDATFARIDDGPEEPVSLATVAGALRALSVGPRRAALLAAAGRDGTRVVVDGLAYEVEVEDERRARLAQVAGGGQAGHTRRELKAPMPGLVVRVLCDVGAQVASGQPLVVLQAMKMENELGVPHAGTVQAVKVQPGQAVEQGQVLVVLE